MFGSKIPCTRSLRGYNGKRFIVLSEEDKRIVRWMNWLCNRRYCRFYSFDLPDERLVDEFLWSLPYVALNRGSKADYHCLPQRLYMKLVINEQYDGDIESFNKLVDKVDLKDLADYHRDVLGVELLKNNVTSSDKKRFSLESLTEVQREKLEMFCNMPV